MSPFPGLAQPNTERDLFDLIVHHGGRRGQSESLTSPAFQTATWEVLFCHTSPKTLRQLTRLDLWEVAKNKEKGCTDLSGCLATPSSKQTTPDPWDQVHLPVDPKASPWIISGWANWWRAFPPPCQGFLWQALPDKSIETGKRWQLLQMWKHQWKATRIMNKYHQRKKIKLQ